MRSLATAAAVVAAALTLAPLPSPAADATTATRAAAPLVLTQGPLVNAPGQRTIKNAIDAAIQHTPKGATIQVAMWSFDDAATATLLQRAYRRGVHVQALVSAANCATVKEYLQPWTGSTVSGHTSYTRCINESARGASTGYDTPIRNGHRRYTTMHQKTITFSATGGYRYVSFIGSYNLTAEARDHQFNTAYRFVNDAWTYQQLGRIFAMNKWDRPMAGGTLVDAHHGNYRIVAPPQQRGSADRMLGTIRKIPSGRGTTLRISTSGLSGARAVHLANAIAAKAKSGTCVTFVHTYTADATAMRVLRQYPGRIHIANTQPTTSDPRFNHSKMMLWTWRDSSGRRQYRSWEGSEQMASLSLSNDEVTSVVPTRQAYATYTNFMKLMWKDAYGAKATLPC